MEPKRIYEVRLALDIKSHYEGGLPTGDHLRIEDQFSIQTWDFLDLMRIIGQVKELADKLRGERTGKS